MSLVCSYEFQSNFLVFPHLESKAPYALCGDFSGNFIPCGSNIFTVGTHTVTATPTTGGVAGHSLMATFTVVPEISGTPPPSPAPTPVPPPVPTDTPTAAPTASPTITRSPTADSAVLGELKQWHKITISFTGPFADEMDPSNPFLNYRLDVTFTHRASGKQYVVPGFFAADGDAANSSASSGDQWHVHFSPCKAGLWEYTASFVWGSNVAVDGGGTPTSFDGSAGSFIVNETDKAGRDHRGKGRLQYIGKHHLQFAETGEFFLKCGSDSPENFLVSNLLTYLVIDLLGVTLCARPVCRFQATDCW